MHSCGSGHLWPLVLETFSLCKAGIADTVFGPVSWPSVACCFSFVASMHPRPSENSEFSGVWVPETTELSGNNSNYSNMLWNFD